MKRLRTSATVALIVAAVAAAAFTLGGKAFFSTSSDADAPVPTQTYPREVTGPASGPVRLAGPRNESAPGELGVARGDSTAPFEADAAGQLVTNEQTRL